MNRFVDITGLRYGRVVATQATSKRVNKKVVWLCHCDCGRVVEIRGDHLRRKETVSCGCYRPVPANKRYFSDTVKRLRTVWNTMHQRCSNLNNTLYARYGARGIYVCDRWSGPSGFDHFLQDLGVPSNGRCTIERVDNDGPYAPHNCRWATTTEQGRNKRNNRYLTYDKQVQLLQDWAVQHGVPYRVLHQRLSRGWTPERALTQPLRSADTKTTRR